MADVMRKAGRPGRIGVITLCCLLGCFAAAAQQPKPGTSAPVSAQGPKDRATIKSNVRQVVVDVVVTDEEKPVGGLRQEDFAVFEDDVPQQIVHFEAHKSPATGAQPTNVGVLSSSPRKFVNVGMTDEHLPLTVLLFDLLNTPSDEQPYAREQLLRFLKSRSSESRCAVFVLGDKLRLIQGFTDDERQLTAAMESKYAMATHAVAGEFLTDSELRNGAGTLTGESAGPESVDLKTSSAQEIEDYYRGERIARTITAFKEIARFLGGWPGRKNLIWLSGSFSTGMFMNGKLRSAIGSSAHYASGLQEAENLLAMGQVAVYPVDARGLSTDPSYGGRGGGMRAGEPRRFLQSIEGEHGTMDEIAHETGGEASYNTNGIAQAIARSINDGTNYYSLSYNPTNSTFDGGVRKIHVKLQANRYHLAYRRSYVAVDDGTLAQGDAVSPEMRIRTALVRGTPVAHDIVLEVDVEPKGTPSGVTSKQIEMLSHFPAYAGQAGWDQVQLQHYAIEYVLRGGRISFAPLADEKRNGIFDVQLAAFDKNGEPMYFQFTRIEKAYSAQEFAAIQNGSYRLRQETDLPTDAAWLRVAVWDEIGMHLGSIEIPLPLPAETKESTKLSPN